MAMIVDSLEDRLDEVVPGIAGLDRFSLYASLGLIRVMEPETETLMVERAWSELVGDEYDSPHANPWFLHFHGSQFPGAPESACKRKLAYRMMNFPATEAMAPWVTTTGTVGKAGELDIADAWFKGGRLLAIPEGPDYPSAHQLGFVDKDHWLTCSTDLPILPRGWKRCHIVEIKGKASEVVDEMIDGRILQKPDGTLEKVGRGPDDSHIIQLKATIGLANAYDWGETTVCGGCWRILFADIFERLCGQRMNPAISPQRAADDNLRTCPWCAEEREWVTFQMEPPTTGEIYYWSRSWPRTTKSFFFEHDPEFIAAGLEVLAETREHFIADEIPPRPEHFQWSLGACKWCEAKPWCKTDFGLQGKQRTPRPENVRTRLTESAGVDHTQAMRPHYDPEATRARVFKEWGHVG